MVNPSASSGSCSKPPQKTLFTRPKKLTLEFQETFLQSQLDCGSFVDCKLICGDGGVIRLHSAVLEAMSPFFRRCFESQAHNFTKLRDVILPDFTLSQVKPVIQLLYCGGVQLPTERTVNEVRGLLAFLEIEIQDDLFTTRKRKGDDVDDDGDGVREIKVLKRRRAMFPQDEEGEEEKKGAPAKKIKKPKKKSYNFSDDDWQPTTSDDSSDESIRSKRTDNSTKNKEDEKKKQLVELKKQNWLEPNYKDRKWFMKAAKTCQVCKKLYEGASEASTCVTGHKSLRCYFCFIICDNTEDLFDHFKVFHKQAGKENCLLCPYCEQSVPYKSVSCHVIYSHLNGPNKGGHNILMTSKVVASIPSSRTQGRPVTTIQPAKSKNANNNPAKPRSTTSSTDTASKNEKGNIEDLKSHPGNFYIILPNGSIRPGKLDVTIKRRGVNSTWFWNIKKKT